jgi:hypothetical protein
VRRKEERRGRRRGGGCLLSSQRRGREEEAPTSQTAFIIRFLHFHTVRAGSVLELDVSLNSVSFHREFRKETAKHGQIIILGQFEMCTLLAHFP